MSTGSFCFNFGAEAAQPESEEPHVIVQSPAEEFNASERDTFVAWSTVELPFSPSAQPLTLQKAVVSSAAAAAVIGDAALADSDLVAGKYEGGFKVWEGALDLAAELLRRFHDPTVAGPEQGALRGQRVLELGCGHGLPGIAAMLMGADCVFHDFNKEVLRAATCPNVFQNARARGDALGERSARARFLSGDFESVCALLSDEPGAQPFNIVLTSESIYNPHSAAQLLRGCRRCLAPGGTLFVAAKSHYFGVGGGLAAFRRQVAADGAFEAASAWRQDDGASNMREVLALTWRQQRVVGEGHTTGA